MLKLIVDENIAFADLVFNQFGEVKLLPGRQIENKHLIDADVLIVRSITEVNESLLKNTPVKFVGTATIGTDHIDLDYLKKNKITFADAKGCNAFSVAEYVVTALISLAVRFDFNLAGKTIGIVGVGNVGSKVTQFAEALGMNVLLNDPPLQRKGDIRNFVELDEILSADIITLHVPLNTQGIDKTYHLFDIEKLNKIKDGSILINTSRGAVVNNNALLDVILKKNLKVVLDVWENEPNVNIELLKNVLIATPHIAGYSAEGKVNGTKMIYNSLCEFINTEKSLSFVIQPPENSIIDFDADEKLEISLEDLISKICLISDDDMLMREMIFMNQIERVKYFDGLRKNYPERREFNNYTVRLKSTNSSVKNLLEKLRFNVL